MSSVAEAFDPVVISSPDSLFGGDDIDYSIRIKDAGYRLVVNRGSFVFHFYGTTGKRLHKDWDDAVLRAIDRTGSLPRDVDGRVPPTLIMAFRPQE